jgi:hypothetical protein
MFGHARLPPERILFGVESERQPGSGYGPNELPALIAVFDGG